MSIPITIAIDAMGGDHGVNAAVPGAALILKDRPHVRFIFFGDENEIRPVLSDRKALEAASSVVHTDKRVHDHDKPSLALRTSKGTSMRMAIEAVHNGEADAAVSSGNTGALMALAKMVLRPLEGIHRPAIASVFPALTGQTTMLDLGANVLVDAENLVQFAVMGAVFARAHRGIGNPTIGLLNVGSEEMKGPDHVRAAASILQTIDLPGRYIGFVEGNDITKGGVDVIVSDGYVGNIALKAVEGTGKLAHVTLKETFKGDPLAMLGATISYFAFRKFKHKMDPRRYNGGVFLGLNGICVKSHGGTDPLGFSSAGLLALELAEHGYIKKVSEEIKHMMSLDAIEEEGGYPL